MTQIFLLLIPRRKLLTQAQLERISLILMETGKLILGGFVIGYFVPDANLDKIHLVIGILLALLFFIFSVVFIRKGKI